MRIMTKVIYLLSIVAHVMGNSVGRWSTCPSCDIGNRSQDLQWVPVPNMGLCMYGYDPFEMRCKSKRSYNQDEDKASITFPSRISDGKTF